MDTTAHRKQHVQDFYSGTKSQLGDRHEDLNESPLQLLQAQVAQARLVESSMKILTFGLRVLLNLLIPLILSLAKILPLRILGSSIRIWGMSRDITLYADVPGFSIKLSANSDQSPPWGRRLILIKEKKKVLQAQLNHAIYLQSGCESFQTGRKYIRALSTREFDGSGYEPTSYSKFNKELDTMILLQLPGSCLQLPGFCPQVPGSYLRAWVPASGSGSCLRLPGRVIYLAIGQMEIFL
ncbi:hypothetical protein F2Q70_00026461 [Brassica cretica]|uniref:Uncharacterized protein n=1 Tax=Brassica cretica TaxID=69181 RepID=A0A8S9L7M3_BRACR|nr:hypothetical protein F2Q70_00026461 [Brassica cretica]